MFRFGYEVLTPSFVYSNGFVSCPDVPVPVGFVSQQVDKGNAVIRDIL